MLRLPVLCFGLFTILSTSVVHGRQASFTLLDVIRSGDRQIYATGVSADGSVIVGASGISAAPGKELYQSFRWSHENGFSLIDMPGGDVDGVFAADVSADGNTVVGRAFVDGLVSRPFRWTQSGGYSYSNGVADGWAEAVSNDGSVVVGYGMKSGWDHKEGFYSKNGGLTSFVGDFPGGFQFSIARDVSGDGSTVVGGSATSGQASEAFRWSESTGLLSLGIGVGGLMPIEGHGVSRDGSTIVGLATVPGQNLGNRSFRWTLDNGVESLLEGPLEVQPQSWALDVSDDGSVIVGFASRDGFKDAFVWTEGKGMLSLRDLLIDRYGFESELNNLHLYQADAISADGTTIVGSAACITPDEVCLEGVTYAFVATVPEPATATTLALGILALAASRRRLTSR